LLRGFVKCFPCAGEGNNDEEETQHHGTNGNEPMFHGSSFGKRVIVSHGTI
jgi:hypothetical protein